MDIVSNPTAKLSRSQIWGFEVSHVLIAVSIMLATNSAFSLFGIPVIFSWAIGIGALLGLRLVSHGKKSGHISFLLLKISQPSILLGSIANFRKERTQ